MGKVLDSFLHLFPGAVSRTADEIVISLKNAGNGAIYPGTAVFLAADGGVTAVRPGSTFDRRLTGRMLLRMASMIRWISWCGDASR